MASSAEATTTLEGTSHIPIAQLSPLLASPSSRHIKAIVTLTWPYSSITGVIAYLLAEPDFRLRRTRGQVRVQFAGSSAKRVAQSHISSGDEVILCLDEVTWLEGKDVVGTPGRGVQFEMKFTERALLQFRPEESQDVVTIDINHPEIEPEHEVEPVTIDSVDIFIPLPKANEGANAIGLEHTEDGIFSSPAFVKRARTSYGSLFELDPFAEEDGTVRGKGRKRTRLSSAWKYSSRSPTPEREPSGDEASDVPPTEPIVNERPAMTDEGCQTVEIEMDDAAETLANFSRQAINVGNTPYSGTDIQLIVSPEHRTPDLDDRTIKPPPIKTYTPIKASPSNGSLKASLSPRLQPQSSNSLPLISPLVLAKYGMFPGQTGLSSTADEHQNLSEPPTSMLDPLILGGEQEDLYNASPRRPNESGLTPMLPDFQPAIDGKPDLASSHFEPDSQFIGETLYNQFQLTEAPPNRISVGHETSRNPNNGQSYADGIHNRTDNSLPVTDAHASELQRYTDPNGSMMEQDTPSWGSTVPRVYYPNLSAPQERIDGSSLLETPSAPMSRSQIVNLTEGSDQSQGSCDGNKSVQSTDDTGSTDDDYHESMSRAETREYRTLSDQEETKDLEDGPQGSEASYDGYEEDGNDGNDAVYYIDLERDDKQFEEKFEEDENEDASPQYSEEDEESYDEDIEGTPPPRPAPQKEPVIIDLLSSDDEDEPTISPKPAAATRQRPGLEVQTESEGENSYSEDEDGDGAPTLVADQNGKANDSEADEPPDEDLPDNKSDFETETEFMTGVSPQSPMSDSAAQDEGLGNEPDYENDSEDSRSIPPEVTPMTDGDLGSVRGYGGQHSDEDELVDELVSGYAVLEPEPRHDTPIEDAPVQETDNLGEAIEEMEEGLDQGQDNKMRIEISAEETIIDNAENDHAHYQLANDGGLTNMEVGGPSPQATQALSEVKGDRFMRKRLSVSVLSLDGTYEEHIEEHIVEATSQYVILEREDPFTSLTQNETTHISQAIDIQLPTPDDTQRSENINTFPELSDAQIEDMSTENIPTEQASPELLESEHPELELKPDITSLQSDSFMDNSVEESLPEQPEVNSDTDIKPKENLDDENAQVNEESYVKTTEVLEEITSVKVVKEASSQIHLTDEAAADSISSKAVSAKVRNDISEHAPDKEAQHSSPAMEDSKVVEPPIAPRRSHRRVKSAASSVDTKQTVQPRTPDRIGKNTRPASSQADRTLPAVVIDVHKTPQGHDASVEIALSSLASPSKTYDLRKAPVADIKLRLSRALRTELSEFTTLKVLRYHINQKLDVLAIATTSPPEPQRSKSGQRHYQVSFNVTDHTIAPSSVTEVQIFRPYKDALPIVKSGDGILLRNFQVTSIKKGFALRSDQNDASSWAVFRAEEEVDIRGPPVEFGDGEKQYVAQLKTWYEALDATSMAKISRANADKSS